MRDVREEQAKKERVRTPFLTLLYLAFKAEFLRRGEGDVPRYRCGKQALPFPAACYGNGPHPSCFAVGRQELLTSFPQTQ